MAQKETPDEAQNREMVESIASNIEDLSKSVRSLLNGRVNRKAVVVLLAHSTKFPQSTVKSVLEALENLERDYLKK